MHGHRARVVVVVVLARHRLARASIADARPGTSAPLAVARHRDAAMGRGVTRRNDDGWAMMATTRGDRGRRRRVFASCAVMACAVMSVVTSARAEAMETGGGDGNARWTLLELDEDAFRTRRSFETPAYDVGEDGRARFRGWFSAKVLTTPGMDALREPVPERVRPIRDETWKVTMKGQERVLTLTTEGRLIVGDEYDADTWFVLNGLEYDTESAFEDASTCDATTGSCEL